MTRKHLVTGSVAVLLFVAGVLLGRSLGNEEESDRVRALEKRAGVLSRQLRDARSQPRRTDPVEVRRPAAAAEPETPAPEAGILADLSRMVALGKNREAAEHWIRLLAMSAADLESLGLSRIALAAALAREKGLLRFVLEETGLDPALRRFAARTLEQAGPATRRAVLDTLDFSNEKDKSVLHPMVRAARDFRDPLYVDRFAHLVGRTDLYNNARQNIAFMIAEIGGEQSRRALDEMKSATSGAIQRILPVLELVYAPPETGLLVTNAGSPAADRIGLTDIILTYNETRIRTNEDLVRADASTEPGDVVAVEIVRDGVKQTIYLTVTNTAPGHLHFNATEIRKKD